VIDTVRIEVARIADSIGLIDSFREAGLTAGLGNEPGTWNVEVAGSLDDVGSVLFEWMARSDRDLMLAHAGERLYLMAPPAAATAGMR
jgi:hypothetical protein